MSMKKKKTMKQRESPEKKSISEKPDEVLPADGKKTHKPEKTLVQKVVVNLSDLVKSCIGSGKKANA